MSQKNTAIAENPSEATMLETMSDVRYLRQSSSLINDALQKGFDVLQLADGDVVMTGVKTVIYQYTWDATKGKLVRTKAASTKNTPTPFKPTVNMDELDAEEDEDMFEDAILA